MVEIRLFASSDISSVFDIYNLAREGLDFGEDTSALDLERELSASHLSIVACESDVVLGFGSIYGCFIEDLYVNPSHWKKGVGSILLWGLEEHAKKGYDSVLVVPSGNSKEFYLKRGYKEGFCYFEKEFRT